MNDNYDITGNNHGGNLQSQAANADVAPRKKRVRDMITSWFYDEGPQGAITEQTLKAFSHLRYSTVTARVSELRRDGVLIQIGTRATSYSGNDAAVLVHYKYVGAAETVQPQKVN